jgi:hypothetical protein
MGINKILKDLHKLFNKDKIKKSHFEELNELLQELEKKYKKLKSALNSESSGKARKKIKTELKIVKVQLRKGREKLGAIKKS